MKRATQRPRRASAPRRFAGPGPRCGLGGCARARAELGRAILMVGPQRSKSLSHFLFLIFPVINGSKKIGKENFPVSKIQQLCSQFRCKVKGLLSSNLKSSYSYSVNDEKFILLLKLKPTEKNLTGGIVG